MTKKLNEAAIFNELKGNSSYFRRPASQAEDEQPISNAVPPSQTTQKEPVTAAVAAPDRHEQRSPPSVPSSLAHSSPQPPIPSASKTTLVDDLPASASTLASYQASMLASYQANIIDAIRKTVKKGGKEVTFVRLTPEEKNQLTDLVFTYKRQDIKTSENEISRIAINFLLEDYKIHGDASILAKVIASLLA